MPDIQAGNPCDLDLRWLATDARPLDCNGPADRAFSAPGPPDLERPIIQQLQRVVRCQPDRIAISDAGTRLTFAQLWEAACGLGETIAAGTRPGDLVAILVGEGVLYPAALLACLAAGRPFLVLDSHHPEGWISRVLRDAAPAMIVVPECSTLTAGAARILRLGGLALSASRGWQPTCLDLDEPACVLCSSGSTGAPKAIVNSQRALLQRVIPSIHACHINTDDRLLTLAAPGTIAAVRDVLTALLAGASAHLVDARRLGARQARDLLRKEAITILFGFPALLRLLVPDGGGRAGPALRLVRMGGDTALWSDVERLRAWAPPGALIQQIYAATEAPVTQWFVDSACRGDDPRLPLGFPLPGTHLAVVDEEGRSVSRGQAGELVVAGHAVALGTWQGGRFLPGNAAPDAPGGRLFRSGDLVRQRPDGLLERLGRRDRQVKIRGVRVDPDSLEAVLRQHPGVRDAGVVSRMRGDGVTSLAAWVSARDCAPAGLLDELSVLMDALPAAMRPAHLHQTSEIPRLPGSKLDVRALTALDEIRARQERGSARAGTVCEDRIARVVAKVWQEVLQVPPQGMDQDFFAAGGDSLQAIRLVSRLEHELRRGLSLSLLGEASTFAGLCEVLRSPRAHPGGSLVLLKPGDGSPPLYLVHGAAGQVAELLIAARSMSYPGRVLGIQARGLQAREYPHTTVEAMAADYLGQIRALQPGGPYHLGGYSAGGLVAFEMARQLAAGGQVIGFLGLLDTLPHPHRRRLPATLTALLRGLSFRTLKVAAAGLLAATRYQPGFHAGTLTLFRPLERDPALPDPAAAWSQHAAAVAQVTIPGTHMTMLSGAHAHAAAAALSRQLALAAPR